MGERLTDELDTMMQRYFGKRFDGCIAATVYRHEAEAVAGDLLDTRRELEALREQLRLANVDAVMSNISESSAVEELTALRAVVRQMEHYSPDCYCSMCDAVREAAAATTEVEGADHTR